MYFWSDTHFNHEGILKHTSRNYSSVDEMNNVLIEKWNSVVQNETDTVWHLGDFGFHAPTRGYTMDLAEIWWKLRGKKHLIIGNHDEKNKQVLRFPWESVERLAEVRYGGIRATLCHYPLETWPASWHGSMMFHGHCHGTLKRKIAKRFDVGVDAMGIDGPIDWDTLFQLSMSEAFVPTDGHDEERNY